MMNHRVDEVIALRELVQRQAKEIEQLKERIRTSDATLREPPPFIRPVCSIPGPGRR